MKKLFEVCDLYTPERVILHALYRKSRGKKPSMAFWNERNPRCALKKAISLLGAERVPELIERATEMLAEQQVDEYFEDHPEMEILVV